MIDRKLSQTDLINLNYSPFQWHLRKSKEMNYTFKVRKDFAAEAGVCCVAVTCPDLNRDKVVYNTKY